MGKAPNGLGQFSGKVGGVVFAVSNGEQIVRAYQPVVSNPKSVGQSMQRAKGNLAGRISSFTPKTAIMGLGRNGRMRRGEFLRNILKNAQVDTLQNGYKAKIDNAKVLFSKGAVQLSITNPVVAATATTVGVTLTGVSASSIPEEEYATMQTRLVAMVYDSTTQDLVEVETKIVNKPTQGATAATLIAVNHPEGFIVDVYAIPMTTEDGSAISIDSKMAQKSDTQIAAELSVNANAIVFNYGTSILLGSSQFTPTQTKIKK